jgi:hypothetical protein
MHIRVGVNGLVFGTTYRIADVNCVPGYAAVVYLGREPEGRLHRFALCDSEQVIALSAEGVAERVFVGGPPAVEERAGEGGSAEAVGGGEAMTEAEWEACTDPTAMLHFLRGLVSGRKLRLFACDCCWRIRHLLRDDASIDALNASAQFADGLIDREEMRLRRIEHAAVANRAHPPTRAVAAASDERHVDAAAASGSAADAVADTGAVPGSRASIRAEERIAQSVALRDIAGNPFRPVTFSPEWRTDTVLALARQMYESREFGAMPILADALQDAGCGDDDVLNHCRQANGHVRGCWVIDLVLGEK